MKSGWRTSEFWLASAATVCSMLYASGVISEAGTSGWEKAISFVAAALASLGYSQARAATKAAGPREG